MTLNEGAKVRIFFQIKAFLWGKVVSGELNEVGRLRAEG